MFVRALRSAAVRGVSRVLTAADAAPPSWGGSGGGGSVEVIGNTFKTEMPALRFDFPASGNGDNYFEATVGNIAEGRGRTIKEKDVSFTTNLETGNVEFELRLSDGIRSLTAIDVARNITQNVVDITVSGSIGIVPIRITNLFNNETTIFRVGINSDSTKDSDLIRQIQEQGGTTLQS